MSIPIVTLCGGFLFAVLWMDLMFDTQVGLRSGSDVDEAALASIAGYYRRATTTSRSMSRLIAAVMVVLLVTLTAEAWHGRRPGWLMALSALLAGAPILLALLRTVPNAVRLGQRTDSPSRQMALARAIYRDHLLCAAGMAALLVLWLTQG